MNFEHLYNQKKLCFVHNMLCLNNSVIVTVMGLFIQSNEDVKLVNLLMLLHIVTILV